MQNRLGIPYQITTGLRYKRIAGAAAATHESTARTGFFNTRMGAADSTSGLPCSVSRFASEGASSRMFRVFSSALVSSALVSSPMASMQHLDWYHLWATQISTSSLTLNAPASASSMPM